MNFEKYLTRLDEEALQIIFGQSSLRIISMIDSNHKSINLLKNNLLEIFSPSELLESKIIRNELIDRLKPKEAEDLCDRLGKKIDDTVFETLKAVSYKKKREKKILYEFFDLHQEDGEKKIINYTKTIVAPNYSLFNHQRKAIDEISMILYNAKKKRVMLHMPTGSGKTRTAMNVISNHFRKHPSTVVMWLAHTEELCEQAVFEFAKAWENLGDRDMNIYRYWGNSDEQICEAKDAFIVGGLSKLFNLICSDAQAVSVLASNCSLIVMDEAHMAIAPTFKIIQKVLMSFGSSLLGLSATPGRTWNDKNADQELSIFFGKNKVTLKVEGFTNPIDYLVEEGYLANVKNRSLYFENGSNISLSDLEYFKDNLKLSDSHLKEISENDKRNILIINKTKKLVKNHKRIILFSINVNHSNLLAICLQAIGIKAFSVTGLTPTHQRKKLIDKFKGDEDEPMVLCNYGILTTGFDAPKTSCAIITRPTDSLVLYSQMVGRAIRGVKAGGNHEAEIVTVVDSNLPGFDHISNAFFNWEDIW